MSPVLRGGLGSGGGGAAPTRVRGPCRWPCRWEGAPSGGVCAERGAGPQPVAEPALGTEIEM